MVSHPLSFDVLLVDVTMNVVEGRVSVGLSK